MKCCLYCPEHKVYTYDDSESPAGPASLPDPGRPDAVGVLKETPERPDRSGGPGADGQDDPEEQQKLSRCLSDPGPTQEADEASAFLP